MMGLGHLQRHERRPDRPPRRAGRPPRSRRPTPPGDHTEASNTAWMGPVEPHVHEIGRDADASAIQRARRRRHRRRRPIRRACRIGAIGSAHGLHYRRRILDRPAQRSCGVERGRQRHSARPADPAEGGLQTGHSTEAGRDADRAPGVAAHRHRDHPRGDGGTRSAAGPAGNAVKIPGIPGAGPSLMLGGDTPSELVGAGRAHDQRPTLPEPANQLGISRCDPARQHIGPAVAWSALDVEQLLHGHRNAVKGTTAHAPRKLVLQDAGGGAGLLVKDACEGPDHPVDGPNPLERSVEHLHRAGPAGTVETGEGAGPQLPELGHRFRRIVGTAS